MNRTTVFPWLLLSCTPVGALEKADLLDLPFEELLDIEVVTASHHPVDLTLRARNLFDQRWYQPADGGGAFVGAPQETRALELGLVYRFK